MLSRIVPPPELLQRQHGSEISIRSQPYRRQLSGLQTCVFSWKAEDRAETAESWASQLTNGIADGEEALQVKITSIGIQCRSKLFV